MITSKSKIKQASRNQVGLTFGVGLTFKVLSSKWGLLSRVGLTIEWAYYRINTVCLFFRQFMIRVPLMNCAKGNQLLLKVFLVMNTMLTQIPTWIHPQMVIVRIQNANPVPDPGQNCQKDNKVLCSMSETSLASTMTLLQFFQ